MPSAQTIAAQYTIKHRGLGGVTLQTWTGTTQKRKIAFSGNRLTVTSEPTKLSEGQEVVFEVVFERVE